MTKPRLTRDNILFWAGLIGVAYQTVVEKADRPTLLILLGTMMGLPVFLAVDEIRNRIFPTKLSPETRVVTNEKV